MSTKLKPGFYQAYSPSGKKIIGTLEQIPGVANIYGFAVYEDGSVDPEYAGETDVEWDNQVTETDDNGDRIFIDEDGAAWPEPKVKFRKSKREEWHAQHTKS